MLKHTPSFLKISRQIKRLLRFVDSSQNDADNFHSYTIIKKKIQSPAEKKYEYFVEQAIL